MQRDDNGFWCLPSGGMDSGESVTETIVREVQEETGPRRRGRRPGRHVFLPACVVQYPDGNRFQIVSLCFAAEVLGGELHTTDEAISVGYLTRDEVAAVDVMANHVERIRDAFAYQGSAFIR
jgi:ADP-ribose pyrophosphatase YjhB (NUDIX family)